MEKQSVAKQLFCAILIAGIAACQSKETVNNASDFNGGFELFEDGLPLNWIVYDREKTRLNDFDVFKDSVNFAEGKASLKFVVRDCSGKPGRYSPGLTGEIKAKADSTYKVSFKVKNNGCKWVVNVSGVSAFNAGDTKVVTDSLTVSDWQSYECLYTMPEKMENIRFELNVLSPGQLNLDDVRIETVQAEK